MPEDARVAPEATSKTPSPRTFRKYRGPLIVLYLAGFFRVVRAFGAHELPADGTTLVMAILSGFTYPFSWLFSIVTSPAAAFADFYEHPLDDLLLLFSVTWLCVRWARGRRDA